MKLIPVSSELLFQGRSEYDRRMGHFSRAEETPNGRVVVIGYPDDEGVRLSLGRPGAGQAPDMIRKYFYKMTSSVNIRAGALSDIGNIENSETLSARHQFAFETVKKLHQSKKNVISIGGGHDYGYPDIKGFLSVYGNQNPLVVNFDAHLDVRDLEFGPTSGTPFFRIRSEFGNIPILEIGIQPQCNSIHHKTWARENAISILDWETLSVSPNKADSVLSFLSNEILKKRDVFLSIDLDCMSSAFAPGCSQSFPTGFAPDEVLTVIEILCYRSRVRHLGLYETSPPLDVDNRTSILAAQFAHRFTMMSLQ